jgi:hypothetical protein
MTSPDSVEVGHALPSAEYQTAWPPRPSRNDSQISWRRTKRSLLSMVLLLEIVATTVGVVS